MGTNRTSLGYRIFVFACTWALLVIAMIISWERRKDLGATVSVSVSHPKSW